MSISRAKGLNGEEISLPCDLQYHGCVYKILSLHPILSEAAILYLLFM